MSIYFTQGSNISINRSPQLKKKKINEADQSVVSIAKNCATQADALKLLNEPALNEAFKVLKLKIIIDGNFTELSTINLKKLQQKFKNQSFVIFIAANNDTRFHIYWKSKDSQKVLSLKPYNDCFPEPDKDLCEFVSNSLASCLENGHTGEEC